MKNEQSLESADRQEQTNAIVMRITRPKEKIAKPKTEMARLEGVNERCCAEADNQIQFGKGLSLSEFDGRSDTDDQCRNAMVAWRGLATSCRHQACVAEGYSGNFKKSKHRFA